MGLVGSVVQAVQHAAIEPLACLDPFANSTVPGAANLTKQQKLQMQEEAKTK